MFSSRYIDVNIFKSKIGILSELKNLFVDAMTATLTNAVNDKAKFKKYEKPFNKEFKLRKDIDFESLISSALEQAKLLISKDIADNQANESFLELCSLILFNN